MQPKAGRPRGRSSRGDFPNSAEIFCEPERLDDPDGYYEVSNVRLIQVDDLITRGRSQKGGPVDDQAWTDGGLRLQFRSEWVGDLESGVNMCVARVIGTRGGVLFDYEFSFSTARRVEEGARVRISPPKDVTGEATSADITCVPYRTPDQLKGD